MAINTRSRRASAVAVLQPWGVLLPDPDGTIGQEDRQHLAGVYAGIATSALFVDTSSKRGSALRVLQPYQTIFPFPDSSVALRDRAHISLVYSGSAFGVPDPAAHVDVITAATGVGTILASGTCSVVASVNANLTTPPAINSADVVITATASGDLLETLDPVFVVVTASANGQMLGAAQVSVTATVTAAGNVIAQATCSIAVTASAFEASGLGIGRGQGTCSAVVLASAVGSYSAPVQNCDVVIGVTARGTSIGYGVASPIVSVQATGDDGVPDPTSGSADVIVLCRARGSLIAPSQPRTPVPFGRTIDFKSIADYYNRSLASVPSYEFSGGRKFYEREL